MTNIDTQTRRLGTRLRRLSPILLRLSLAAV